MLTHGHTIWRRHLLSPSICRCWQRVAEWMVILPPVWTTMTRPFRQVMLKYAETGCDRSAHQNWLVHVVLRHGKSTRRMLCYYYGPSSSLLASQSCLEDRMHSYHSLQREYILHRVKNFPCSIAVAGSSAYDERHTLLKHKPAQGLPIK